MQRERKRERGGEEEKGREERGEWREEAAGRGEEWRGESWGGVEPTFFFPLKCLQQIGVGQC